MLELDLKEKGYDQRLLGDLNLQIAAGDRLALVGPSGCGKTTLLNIIGGLDRAFKGQRRLADPEPKIAYMFQEPRLLPWRTVEQNLRMVCSSRNQALDLLDEVALLEAACRYPRELSLGMARRVALARALALEPDLLLLDEPLVSLDPSTALRMLRLVETLLKKRPKMALVLVSHNPDDAVRIGAQLLEFDTATGEVLLPNNEKSASAGQLLV
ncbi:ATP-binding cassette domain-containing protein [Marinobacterium mangrovicola]|uniref:NitT/TauT family transport system ATP-binding protein n=1 Tax=Marinobacterium mangrovicola TaxID=1476959 RepID=A0A4R1GKT8_9GAMM|nr:ATP-binding cassette domain-containing protein [Marinobacterium mangrovicola]TCK09004.1 NitT/TauT family transport system ATP-binding protein [Marinobacterium mangrovicola]